MPEMVIDPISPESPSPLAGEGLGRGGVHERARALRQASTETEKHLWLLLKAKRLAGGKFRRQYPIGNYIVDFACPAARLIVEADGSQHLDSGRDKRRDAWLAAQGWRVLRFWNSDILSNDEGVLAAILAALPPLPPTASRRAPPSPTRGEGFEGRD